MSRLRLHYEVEYFSAWKLVKDIDRRTGKPCKYNTVENGDSRNGETGRDAVQDAALLAQVSGVAVLSIKIWHMVYGTLAEDLEVLADEEVDGNFRNKKFEHMKEEFNCLLQEK